MIRFLAITTALVCVFATAPVLAADLYSTSPFHPVVAAIKKLPHRGSVATVGNHVHILNDGYQALLLRVHLIRNATRSIRIQTFIWSNDECGRLLMYELIEAARRGVRVEIIADHFVSAKDPEVAAFLATVHPNIELKHYRPAAARMKPTPLQVLGDTVFKFRQTNQRMHNKIMVFDNVIAITGGRNIENSYFHYATSMNFKDRDIMVAGPVVRRMTQSFRRYWDCKHAVPSRELLDVAKLIETGDFRRYAARGDYGFHGFFVKLDREASDSVVIKRQFVDRLMAADIVEFIADKPGKNRAVHLRGSGEITERLKETIASARRSLVIQSPYLVISPRGMRIFRTLKKRQPMLRIQISTNSYASTDNIAAYSANYRLRPDYIDALNFHVYEYMAHPADLLRVFPTYPQMKQRAESLRAEGKDVRLPFLCIHGKSFVIDDHIAYVGSYNLDPRSANLNTEVGLLIHDAEVAEALRRDIRNDMKPENSWVIGRREMPLELQALNGMMSGLSRLGPLDVWPVQNTTSFELIPGKTAVQPGSPKFYNHYRDAGEFPGAPPGVSKKAILTRLYKAVSGVVVPIL
jgi:putative cardiolipin synthase